MGKEVSICAILILGIAMLFFPAQQGYAVFTLAPELNDEQLIELYKLKELVFAEQARDKFFVLDNKQNPYLDTVPNAIAYFENNEEESLNSVDQRNENFQLMKDEQISIAEKKYKEILGDKIISNPLFDEPVKKESIHELITDIQIDHVDRGSDEFKDYRLLQISIAEEFRDNNWKNSMSQKQFSNPYLINEPISKNFDLEERKILKEITSSRESEKHKNAILKQIVFAEHYRDKILNLRVAGNPYSDENLIQNIEESLDAPIRNAIINDESEPTYAIPSLVYRESEKFETVKALEIEIAQNTLNGMAFLSNSEELDEEILSSTDENKKLNNVERGDKGFEFFKNKQIDAAEKKLMEILGQKNIHNSDY